jgi:chemotaxis signal transduction protein
MDLIGGLLINKSRLEMNSEFIKGILTLNEKLVIVIDIKKYFIILI